MLERLPSSMLSPDNPYQFAYKSIRSTLHEAFSLIHHNCESLDASMKSIRCIILDYSVMFYSALRPLVFHKLETFGLLA